MALQRQAVVAVISEIMNQNDEEEEAVMMIMARIAAMELMELEGDDIGDFDTFQWEKVTVFIDEYHAFGDVCFKMHFRMSRRVFEELTATVKNYLVRKGKLKRERTKFQDIMLMVVWLLATPDSFRSVALKFGVHPTTLHYFYTYVIEALRNLAKQFIIWPDEEERREIASSFERTTGFPGVVGCIDGTHVNITAPLDFAPQYTNRHDTYSMNVQAVVDNRLLVRHLHVGEVGSMHDNRVFRRSSLHDGLLQGGDERLVDPDQHLVGDGAYTLTDFMMIPFANNGRLTEHQQLYNKRLSQSRVKVENAFARAKGKWRRLKFLHARNQEYVVDYITAAFVLHNFIILNGDGMWEEEELMRPVREYEILGNEDFHNADDPVNEGFEELAHAAEVRGVEKRIFIMDHVIDQQ